MNKKLIAAILLLGMSLVSYGAPSGDSWPDGSPVDRWFFQESKAPRGRQAREFSIMAYGAVADSTILQTAAIQKA
ncbi:MAG: hypothetical protein K5652_04500, partial [Bacteroidales bacterium]|nr:hypothetical protein [Bacteroidales bacterium]